MTATLRRLDEQGPGASVGGMDRRRFLFSATAAATPLPAQAQMSDSAYRALLDRLADPAGESVSLSGAARRRTAATARAAALAALNPQSLSAESRVLHAAALDGARTEAAFRQLFPFGSATGVSPYLVHPRAGAHTRPNAGAQEFDAETERLQADAARGVIFPAELLATTLERLAAARSNRSGDTAAALERQIAALEAFRAGAPADPGVWRLAGGVDYYALALSLGAGGRVAPAAAHRRGLDEARRLRARADALLRRQGLTRGSVAERLRALTRDPRYLYPATDAGKIRAVAEMNASLARADAALPRAFSDRAVQPGEVRRMSAEDEAAGRPGRREPNAYVVDLIHIRNRPDWTLPSVVHHELRPGHLLQEERMERPPHPLQTRYAPGFGEGWANYAEQLADEIGLFDGDERARIGWLQWRLFRVARLVADTGVHLHRWTRQRAIQEMRDIQGGPIAFITIEEDVDRIIAAPGAAAGQGLAMLEFGRLRDASRARLGARFDLKGFHDAMLKRGPLGAPGLQAALELWEAELRAS